MQWSLIPTCGLYVLNLACQISQTVIPVAVFSSVVSVIAGHIVLSNNGSYVWKGFSLCSEVVTPVLQVFSDT